MITSSTYSECTIDWYSITVDSPVYDLRMTMLCTELDRGMMGYTVGVRFADGRIELSNPNRPNMRNHIIMTGQVLETIEAIHNVLKQDVLRLAMPNLHVARLDIVVDIKNGSLPIGQMACELIAGNAVTKAKTYFHVQTLSGAGETLYIGSPKSKKRVRIYDKAAEQGIDGDWTRIEAQIRAPHASALRGLLNTGGFEKIPEIINGLISFPSLPSWEIMLGNASVKLPVETRPETDTRKWLLTTCAKALAKEVEGSPDGDMFLAMFTAAVHEDRLEAASKWFKR